MKSFPKPLSTKDETDYLIRCKTGDIEETDIDIVENIVLEEDIKKYIVL